MAIDPRIALGFQTPEQPSQLNMLAQALQLQGMQRQNQLGSMQLRDAEAAAQERAALKNYLSGGANIDTPEGEMGLYKVAPTQAAGILKGRLDLTKTRGEIAKDAATVKKTEQEAASKAFELKREKFNFSLQGLAGVQTPEQAAQWIQGGVQSGLIDMKQATQELQGIPRDPQGFAQWKQAQQAAGLTIAQQMEQQWKAKDFGLNQQRFAETQRSNRASEAISAGNLGVARANLGLRQKEIELGGKAPAGYVWGPADESGRPSLVPIKGGPADPASKANAANITEGERNSGGYASRMAEATKLLDQFEEGGRETYLTRGVGATPVVGSAARGEVMTETQQKYRQAAEDWVRAKLRKESGAVIGKDEMEAEIQTYFPMPWDKAGTREQKRQAREVANRAMATAAGRGFKPDQPATARPGSSGSWEGWSIEPVK